MQSALRIDLGRLRGASLLACLLATAVARVDAAAQAGPEFRSAHYAVRAPDAVTAEELARVLELAWPQLGELFQREPDLPEGERLRVRVAAGRGDWVAALNAEGVLPPPGVDGVWYRPESRTLHLYAQRNAYATRALALKGACQQFFDHLKAKNADLVQAWYVRGIAEHLAMHRLDGATLELGVRLRFANVDYVTEAEDVLRRLEASGGGLTEADFDSPAFAWCLSRYLLEGPERRLRRKFEKLALGVTGSKVDGPGFAQGLGDPQRLARGMLEWLPTQASPWIVELGEWLPESGMQVRATALDGKWAVARPRGTPELLEVFVEPAHGVRAGVALEYDASAGDVARTVAAVVDADVLRILRSDRLQPERLNEVERLRAVRGDDGRVHLRLVVDGARRVLYVGGQQVYGLDDARHPACLVVQRGSAVLRIPEP